MQSTSVIPGRGDGLSFFLPLQAGFDNEDWYVSDFTIRSTFFRVGWVPENVHYDGETLALELTRIPVDNQPNSGAEVQKRGFYGYGRYEVVMQAAPGSGVVSAFFTHTDETFGDPHDEIDIEFLGNDTRRMHANVFTNGISNGSIYIDLPFDAAESVHLYAFDWRPDSVRWYIDNELVHTVTSAEQAIPSTPGRVIMDIWTGSKAQYSWHGEPTFQDGTKAYYYCVSFQALGDTSPQCSDHTESAPGGIVSPTSPTVE
ncbi:family 16 glycosylhydrolase [Hyphomonas johnsonii]|uniref:family 16 glycosylhydrolase n=1 Tax=Hyphomonas johnsonii TaxID=81031 RepID=UPI00138E5345|nr:family 16 glycosylhydrolase [Hyphomonas johnsonii]